MISSLETETLTSGKEYEIAGVSGITQASTTGWGLSFGNGLIATFCLILIGLFAVIALLAVFVTMMLRSAIIVALLCFTPIAFAAWIFPDTEKYWKMWWQQFIKWCTFPVIFGLMLWIGISAVNNLGTTQIANASVSIGMIPFIIRIILFSMFLVGGLIFSVQGGGAAAQFVMKQGSKVALGLGSAGLGFALGRIVNSGWYNKIAEKLSAKEGKLGEKPILGAITRPISTGLYSFKAQISSMQEKKEEQKLKAISGEQNALTNYIINARALGKTETALRALEMKAKADFEFTDNERKFILKVPDRLQGLASIRALYKYNPALRNKPTAEVASRYRPVPQDVNILETIKTLEILGQAQDFLTNDTYGVINSARTIKEIADFIERIPPSKRQGFMPYLKTTYFGGKTLKEWLNTQNSKLHDMIDDPYNPPAGIPALSAADVNRSALIKTYWD
jgi:hypothetical protein